MQLAMILGLFSRRSSASACAEQAAMVSNDGRVARGISWQSPGSPAFAQSEGKYT
jgi:hypothetical protein